MLASDGSWMHDLLADWAPSGNRGSLRLAIRNGYVNFYRLGQSVSKVEFRKRQKTATATIHHKYVRIAKGQTYFKVRPTEGLDDAGNTCDWGGSTMLASWIARASRHANREKKYIDNLLNVSPRIIDLEIALPARDDKRSAPRIDIAALDARRVGPGARLVFWEVKRINDARLRSRSVPKVIEQIEAYERYVRNDRPCFEKAYRETCRLLCKFHRIASDLWGIPPLDPLISAVADGECLEVDAKPRLLIIEDEKPKRNWEHHRRELTKRLTDRVHLVCAGDVKPIETVPRVSHRSV